MSKVSEAKFAIHVHGRKVGLTLTLTSSNDFCVNDKALVLVHCRLLLQCRLEFRWCLTTSACVCAGTLFLAWMKLRAR